MRDSLRHARLRLRALFDRRRLETELDDELRFHLEMETEKNQRAGMSPAEARRRALATFGGVQKYREECRDARWTAPLEDLGRDVRQGVRRLRASPGFTAVAVLTLALGIGATTAAFSVVDGVLLRPLVYPEAERVHTLWEASAAGGLRPPSYPGFRDWEEQSTVFSALAYVRGDDVIALDPEGPQRLIGAYASGDFFAMMGTPPLLGRTFSGETEERVAVLSHRVWLQRYGADPAVLGRAIATPEGSLTVVGVMPAGFAAPIWADLWVPLRALPPSDRYALDRRNLHVDAQAMGRLAPGVALPRAEAEMAAVAARLADAYPDDAREWRRVSFTSLPQEVIGNDLDTRLGVLSAAVLLVLLVACVNIANLQLARASTRTREIAVRTALGAGRGRLIRQMLTENLVLALAGGGLGTLGAVLAVRVLRDLATAQWWTGPMLPRLDEVTVDGRVLAFALLLSLASALLFGLLPALRASRTDLVEPLKSGTPGAGSGRGTARLRATLVVAQVALALMLVVGAGLLVKTLWKLQRVELGFDPEGVVTVRVFPPAPRYEDPAAAAELYRRLRESLAAVPGVREAALANHLPLVGGAMPTRLVTSAGPRTDGNDLVLFRTVSPEYFSTLRTRVVRGRPLAASDLSRSGGVLVNEAAARQFWPEGDPVGESVTVHKAAQSRADMGEPITAPVVGVVADERYFNLQAPPPPAVFVPYTWNPWDNIFLAVRADGDPTALIPALRRAVLEVDADLPVAGPGFQTEFHTLEEYLAGRTERERLNATLLGAFGGAAFLLAVVGIFGVMAYLVMRRTREIGVRMALGARPASVARQVTAETLRLATAGIVLGLAGAYWATRLLSGFLYEVSATDPVIYGGVALAFAAAALLAGLLPARRASRVDPLVALRTE